MTSLFPSAELDRLTAPSYRSDTTQITVQVLLLTDGIPEDKATLSYAVPQHLLERIALGCLVSVPLNRRLVQGVVVLVSQDTPVSTKFSLKPIENILGTGPLLSEGDLTYYHWLGEQTATPLAQVIDAAIPASILQTPQRRLVLTRPVTELEKLKWQPLTVSCIALLEKSPTSSLTLKYTAQQLDCDAQQLRQALKPLITNQIVAIQTIETKPSKARTALWASAPTPVTFSTDDPKPYTDKQQSILDILKSSSSGIWANALCNQAKTTMATLKRLAEKGAVELEHREQPATPLIQVSSTPSTPKELTDSQQSAVDTILSNPPGQRWWLHGVTGSGKTEVYRALAEQVLSSTSDIAPGILLLLPEIALTGQVGKRLIQALQPYPVAVWHSKLRPADRSRLWRQIQSGEVRIVIGARSAILLPMPNIRLIVVDEAHDGSYKQDSPAPRYDARHLSKYRAQQHHAHLVFGSATPDIADFYHAKQSGYVITLAQRFGEHQLPPVTVVDMRNKQPSPGSGAPAAKSPKPGLLSLPLQEALRATLESKQQAIILMNRRGFYTTVRCRSCDQRFLCPDCDVTMTAHRGHDQLLCHYCSHQTPYPQFCPSCASSELEMLGTGTQRVEQSLQQVFPDARVLRLDTDVAQKMGGPEVVLNTFASGDADILVGTQMVAKGLDLPNVTLVGVLNADGSFQLPDYKATERGFQLLTQVAGRAGRGQLAGRVIFQTYQPHHPVIQLAKAQDYHGFYEYEIEQRQRHGFPPFRTLARLIVSHPQEQLANAFIQSLAEQLKVQHAQPNSPIHYERLGPAPCVIPRIQNRFRFHLLIQCPPDADAGSETTFSAGPALAHLLSWYRHTRQHLPTDLRYFIDVDPQTLL